MSAHQNKLKAKPVLKGVFALKAANRERLSAAQLDEPEMLPYLLGMNNGSLFTIASDPGRPTGEVNGEMYHLQYGYVSGFYPTERIGALEENLKALLPGVYMYGVYYPSEIVRHPERYHNSDIVTECYSPKPNYCAENSEIITIGGLGTIDLDFYRERVKEIVEGDGYSPAAPRMAPLYNKADGMQQKYTLLTIRAPEPNVDCIQSGFFAKIIDALQKI